MQKWPETMWVKSLVSNVSVKLLSVFLFDLTGYLLFHEQNSETILYFIEYIKYSDN